MLLIAGDPGITPQFVDSTSTAVAMRLPQKNDFASCEEGASEKKLSAPLTVASVKFHAL